MSNFKTFTVGQHVKEITPRLFSKGSILEVQEDYSSFPYCTLVSGEPRDVLSFPVWKSRQKVAIDTFALETVEKVEEVEEVERTDMEITIDNLRELARRASTWDPKLLEMQYYRKEKDKGMFIPRGAFVGKPECGSSCCMIGIADAEGMHAEPKTEDWLDYTAELFPALISTDGTGQIATGSQAFTALFGERLKSKLKRRVKGLRLAANMLELKGEIDYTKLPD